jgi:hypothetical protein
MLPGLGDELARGLYFLRPLTGEHIREVIVRPATTKGVVYESEALIDTLVEQTEHAPGGLPLLQFTLTELWDARDAGARMIRAEALAALGGVEGALTRHADQLLTGLGARERDAARRILLRLVTAEGTRARRSEAELLSEGAGRDAERAALEVQGSPLMNLRVQQGELVAAQNYVTLRGPSLAGAHLYAEVQDLTASPPVAAPVEYRITSIVQEDAKYDPTYIGSTFLCTLEQNVDNSGSWQPACPVDADGRRAAIPLAATWNAHGDRVESSSLLTFGCTTGVIAKCYRWGYRPWVTGYGDLVAMHLTCTRLARADYCGNGTPHTRDGTLIDIWDNLPSPGPIQQHDAGLLAELLDFEAGWNTGGAVCLSHARWLDGGTLLAQACPDRLIPPILLLGVLLGGAVCDFESQVLGDGSNPLMFDETGLHLDLL